MARTYAAVELDPDVKPKGWNLVSRSLSHVGLIRKLRKNGFYANFNSLDELERHCKELSERNYKEGAAFNSGMDESGQLSCSKGLFSETRNHQTEQNFKPSYSLRVGSRKLEHEIRGNLTSNKDADDNSMHSESQNESSHKPTSPTSATVRKALSQEAMSTGSISPHGEISRNCLIGKWSLLFREGTYIPITEIPYVGSETTGASFPKDIFLSGYANAEQKKFKTKIDGWKLDLTEEYKLVVHVRTTGKEWMQLGTPETGYEQSIRNVLVCCALFSLLKEVTEVSKDILLQKLKMEFCDWVVSPQEDDLFEGIMLIKQLHLDFTYDFHKLDLFLASMRSQEPGFAEESDADSDSKPVSFKRARKFITADDTDVEPASPERDSKVLVQPQLDSDSDKEPLVLKRMRKVPDTDKDPSEDSSPFSDGEDHVSFCVRVATLKRRRSTSKTNESFLGDACLHGRVVLDHCHRERKSCVDYQDSVRLASVSVNKESFPTKLQEGAQSIHTISQAEPAHAVSTHMDFKIRIQNIMEAANYDVYGDRQLKTEHTYSSGPFPAIDKLWAVASAARKALDYIDRGASVEKAEAICSRQALREFLLKEVELRDYGVSHLFPAASKQKEVAERINYYAQDGDTVVEFCSQRLDYFSLLKERISDSGKKCDYKRRLLSQKRGEELLGPERNNLPTGSKLLICLSLSFNVWGDQLNRIVDYTLELKPKLIVLIAPLFARRLDKESSYNLVWDDSDILQNEVLWPWGLLEISNTVLDKKKGVSPTMFLWSRMDWTTKHQQIASRFGHLQKSANQMR